MTSHAYSLPTGEAPIVSGPGVAPATSRRLLDLAVAGTALLVLAVPMLVIYLIVRWSSRGPGFFAQLRVGQGGRPFSMYKFRTMRVGVGGPLVTASADPRLTRVGAFLRRYSLDELPQLWNVLRGHMTLVGVRPESYGMAVLYPIERRWIFEHRPGLTGPAQIRFRDFDILGPGEVDLRMYIEKVVPARERVDAWFLRRPTFGATVMVLTDTVRYFLGMRLGPERQL
ncbi:sugar transferase [Nonomuraea sediminis]|uniref:sugar transferase n=1 Tax=Nonomuraea sediminis TaxID=2835864 RepID=UPI001BDC79F8|nr:sugar transferase [Nonomuraea sediminis]